MVDEKVWFIEWNRSDWKSTRWWWSIVSLQVLYSLSIECSVRSTCVPFRQNRPWIHLIRLLPLGFDCKQKCFRVAPFASPRRRIARRDSTKNNVLCHVFSIFSWFRFLFGCIYCFTRLFAHCSPINVTRTAKSVHVRPTIRTSIRRRYWNGWYVLALASLSALWLSGPTWNVCTHTGCVPLERWRQCPGILFVSTTTHTSAIQPAIVRMWLVLVVDRFKLRTNFNPK